MEAPAAPSEGRRIAWNSTLLGAGHAIALALGFVTTILVTDTLGQDRYGLLLGAQRLVLLLLVLAHFGLQPLLIREVAARRREVGDFLATVLVLRSGLGLAFALLVLLAAEVAGYLPEHRWLLFAMAGIELLGAFADLFVGICEGRERMGRAALATILRSLVVFTGVLVAISLDGGLEAIVAAYLAGRLVHLVGATALAWKLFPVARLRPVARDLGPTLRQAFPFFAVASCYMALRTLDVTMLTRLAPVTEVSRYGAALNFLDVLMILPMLVQQALLPAFSRLHHDGGAHEVAGHTLLVFSALFLPAAAGLSLLAGSFVGIYPSGEFDAAAPILRILALTLPFVGATTVCATFLTSAGRLWAIVAIYALALPLQGTLNLVLLPTYGAEGVAVATVSAHGVLAVGLVVSGVVLGLSFPGRALLRHLVATAAMSGALVLIDGLPLPVVVPAAALVYFLVLFSLAGESSVERNVLRSLLSGWRER